jgi:hypothetical protein
VTTGIAFSAGARPGIVVVMSMIVSIDQAFELAVKRL